MEDLGTGWDCKSGAAVSHGTDGFLALCPRELLWELRSLQVVESAFLE